VDILLHLIEQYGLWLVFANVLLEQLGLPLPAYPTLIITGALISRGDYSALSLLATAVLAAVISDLLWYSAGKRYGRKVLRTLCRISLSPDSCVNQTESIYLRWGAPSLIVAKFIPGFASVASALAGTIGTRRATFIFFDALGAGLWAGVALFLGSLFSNTIDELLNGLVQLGEWGALLIGLALAVFIATKWWERYRFFKELRMARITVQELDELFRSGHTPTVLDVRSVNSQQSGRIPGAKIITLDTATSFALEDTENEVIVYCACPNEASAARVAKVLMQKGYTRVRPLLGGIDAWIDAGFGVESATTSNFDAAIANKTRAAQ
jgi:membrane protein DedA with SNARE-associated domain/rhodanese-related sulfurtransferase